MSLALAELLMEDAPWTREVVAQKFVEVFKRDPREGYSRNFYALLQECGSGEELLAKIRPNSNKSGAAMRASCLGWLSSIAAVKECAEFQARITHDNDDAVKAAQGAALMSYWCWQVSGLSQILNNFSLPKFLEAHVPGVPWSEPWVGPVGSPGLESVRAAVTAVTNNDTLNKVLRACIAYTGDVDTVATIALSAASGVMDNDLPPELVDGLENGAYGRDYIIKLDYKLMLKFMPHRERK